MPISIQIIVGIIVFSLPILFYAYYFKTLNKKSKQALESLTNHNSETFNDLCVWFKDFDLFKKTNKFDLDIYNTTYDFNDCDLVLNDSNFVIIGKVRFLGQQKYLTPTVFEFGNIDSIKNARQVLCKNIKEVDQDLEIEFQDYQYKNRMTLVIKRINIVLKQKIITGYNTPL